MTKKTAKLLLAGCAVACLAGAQGRSNWNNSGGDAQHTGWERADARISKDSAKDLQLLWKMKLESQPKGPRPLQPPALMGQLISYRGFKELAFVASSADIVYAIDADLGKLFWQKHLEYANREPQSNASSWACPGGLTAMPAMPTPAARGPAPVPPAASQTTGRGAEAPPARGPFTPVGVASLYAISSDGRIHRLNTSTGDDVTQPMGVLPANARLQNLVVERNVLYTTTSEDCDLAPNAVWAVDLTADPPKAASFPLNASDGLGYGWGLGGPTIGMDGTVYIQTGDRLLALTSKDLNQKQSFSTGAPPPKKDPDLNAVSPLVFPYNDGELIVTAGRDGRLHLLNAESLDKSLYDSPPVTGPAGGIWGGLSSWQDADGVRWVLAPVWGAVNPELKLPGSSAASAGSIVAFKLEEQNGAPALTPAWVSREMYSPQPPAIAGGVVLALSSGEFTRQVSRGGETEEHPKNSSRAVLYALDAATGKELYSSRSQISSPAALTGITLANGRIYFATMDGSVYCFGLYMEH